MIISNCKLVHGIPNSSPPHLDRIMDSKVIYEGFPLSCFCRVFISLGQSQICVHRFPFQKLGLGC